MKSPEQAKATAPVEWQICVSGQGHGVGAGEGASKMSWGQGSSQMLTKIPGLCPTGTEGGLKAMS